MNVTSKEKSRKTNADGMPLLVMPMAGISQDVDFSFFMGIPDGQVPPLLKIFDAGYDLWFLYPRFTSYASHDTYSNLDAEYWDFTSDDIGKDDLKEALDYVNTATGKKTNLFGKVDASRTILSGIVNEYDFFKERANKVVLQAPCLTPDPSMTIWFDGKA